MFGGVCRHHLGEVGVGQRFGGERHGEHVDLALEPQLGPALYEEIGTLAAEAAAQAGSLPGPLT